MSLTANIVNVGTVEGDRTGDKGQVPFQKYNAAITELYADIATLIANSTFTFNQEVALAEWTVVHNLGRFPSVAVVDSSGTAVDGDVIYLDANNVILNFSAPFSGVAYLN
jgi:hypothetical protein